LLQAISDADLSNESFAFGTMQNINVGYGNVHAFRITYCGELGWELYVPTEYLQQVYDELVHSGARYDLKHCGYHALNSLRIEKAYREFTHDIGADDSPVEAGLAFTCNFEKPGGFLGMEKVQALREQGPQSRRLVQFLLDDPEPLMYHAEPIYRDGEFAGYTSSAMYGYTLGGSVALGYVNNKDGVTSEYLESGQFEIEVEGQRCRAQASLRPLYDLGNLRSRG
jgi:glycine cleavage system aminomethyltransferase T